MRLCSNCHENAIAFEGALFFQIRANTPPSYNPAGSAGY
ncbi:hypothetical protein A2U01_0066777, partial [Trifolium medium]|nr:hypothetical protein [Trifolium medium]